MYFRPIKYSRLIVMTAIVIAAMSVASCAPAKRVMSTGGINAPEQLDKPYLILVSIDGFRWDYQDKYDTPALDQIAASGIRAESMQPVYPTLTFPNHYSIATGLYPAQHGVVGNDFPSDNRERWYHYKDPKSAQDGSWYGGEPIWVTAEKNGLVSAAYFFVGTEAAIGGISPTYWNRFDASVSGEARIDQALKWLQLPEEKRPHVITLYFEDVDVASHDYGPASSECVTAIKKVDSYIDRLNDGIDKLDIKDKVTVVVVSDHGQSSVEYKDDAFIISDHVDLDGIRIIEGGSFVSLYLNSPDQSRATKIHDSINAVWQHGRAILRDETPEHWRTAENPRFPDIIVQADPNHAVLSRRGAATIKAGDHGWDPTLKDMHGIFLAAGPGLPTNTSLGQISVVDVYPLMLDILDLPAPANIDMESAKLRNLFDDSKP